MKDYSFQIRYRKSNNTVSIKERMNKGWRHFYEIDMDDASLIRLGEWKKHLQGKVWFSQELWDRINECYQFNMYQKK